MFNKSNTIHFLNTVKVNFVSVIIPVFKDMDGLKFTIRSLKTHSFNKKYFEIIVANDGDDDEISKYCRTQRIKCISVIPQIGSYNARNVALKHSVGKNIAFIDSGTVADRNWLKNGVIALKKNDYVGGPVITSKKLLPKASAVLYNYQKIYAFPVSSFMSNLKFAPTTNLFVKRVVLEKVGGFDKRLVSSGDFEFGNRVYLSKIFKQKYNSHIIVSHPVRSFKQLFIKQSRLAKGFNDLVRYYPERFSNLGTHPFYSAVKFFLLPIWNSENRNLFKLKSPIEAMGVFALAYFMSSIQHFYRVYFWATE